MNNKLYCILNYGSGSWITKKCKLTKAHNLSLGRRRNNVGIHFETVGIALLINLAK